MSLKELTENLKGEPPKKANKRILTTPEITQKKVPLQLKVSEEERKKFKIEAVKRGISNSDLFLDIWKTYKENLNI